MVSVMMAEVGLMLQHRREKIYDYHLYITQSLQEYNKPIDCQSVDILSFFLIRKIYHDLFQAGPIDAFATPFYFDVTINPCFCGPKNLP